MNLRRRDALVFLASALLVTRPVSAQSPNWVARSNANAQVLLNILAKFGPESAGSLGINGLDREITDFRPGSEKKLIKEINQARAELNKRFKAEKDPLVRQDLEILLEQLRRNARGQVLSKKYDVAYANLTTFFFGGIRSLLDDQVAPERRPAALVRLKRYTGMEAGYTPVTELVLAELRTQLKKKGLTPPIKAQVERDLNTSAPIIEGIGQLFAKYQIPGYEAPYAKLKSQLAAYEAFVRKEVLPKARTDFRLPTEVYAFSLEQIGVDIPPAQLAQKAHQAYDDLKKRMQQLAPVVAQEKGFSVTDYPGVIRELKKEQLTTDAILPHYKERLAQLEAIIQRENILTLPTRPAQIRLATPAESANLPAPSMRPPRLLGNTGEQGEFILPLNAPVGAQGETQKIDDFTYAAASWTLTAHEARPGHELQFASLVEKGVSTVRGVFAFNSTNVEGWGLYSEHIMQPFMPKEGLLISLQLQLLRAARAFLDPELQTGKVTREQALQLLTEEVGLSLAFATQEVERYTFRLPGQATSYFYGFIQLLSLRQEVEAKLGSSFNQQKFHDFILGQGLLPPKLVRQAVLAEFVT